MSEIHEFFAVTSAVLGTKSVYHVKDRRDGVSYPEPVATKIALVGNSNVPVGSVLQNGSMLAITKQLVMYTPEGGGITSFQRRIEAVNTRYWGGHSAPIVALFTTRGEAMKCFKSKSLRPCDKRWVNQTREVIDLIGEDHPVFSVCHWEALALLG